MKDVHNLYKLSKFVNINYRNNGNYQTYKRHSNYFTIWYFLYFQKTFLSYVHLKRTIKLD